MNIIKKNCIGQTKSTLETILKEYKNNNNILNHNFVTTHTLKESHEYNWKIDVIIDIEQKLRKHNL